MGLFVIIPVAGISGWIIYSSLRALRRGEVAPAWRNRLTVLLVIGVILGIYFAFLRSSQPTANFGVEGFPVPTTIHRLENEVWKANRPPLPIYLLGKLCNFVFGIAIALLPMKFAAMLNQARDKDSRQL